MSVIPHTDDDQNVRWAGWRRGSGRCDGVDVLSVPPRHDAGGFSRRASV